MSCEGKNGHDVLCPTVGVKEIEISVPVAIKGYAEIGEIQTKCCGPAEIVPNSSFCPGRNDAVARYVIREKIRVEVPITFGAKTKVGEYRVDYDDRPDEQECGCGEQECGCGELECGCGGEVGIETVSEGRRNCRPCR